jgi:hypothetical protein
MKVAARKFRSSSAPLLSLGALLVLSPLTFAQAPQDSSSQNTPPPSGSKSSDAAKTPPADAKAQDAPAKKAGPAKLKDGAASPEDERQAKIVADTDRLYAMIQDLKAEVAKSSKDTLSVSVIKKASEIEKLAKSLKERMRNQQSP